MNATGGHLSKEFFELVKSIGEARSKQEEDKIVLTEVQMLKHRFADANVSSSKMKEYLVRAIYVEMLGHHASFAYIHAVKLTQDRNLLCKRIGYLLCSLCLDSSHELLLLLINSIQKDLASSNYMEVDAALSSICKLLSDEMVPAVLPSILNLFSSHSNELVRKKCCMALHAIYRVQPQLIIAEAKTPIRCALCDPDPSVMAASLHLLSALARHDRESYVDLVPSIVSILKQIIEHRVPRDYDYHRMPAPWIQVKLLSLLAVLGEGDQQASEQMQEVLIEVIQRAELGANAGFAVIYEAVKTVTTIYPSSRLLDVAATVISRFISSENHNLKYVGITGLAAIVRVHPSFAARPEHQLVVLDALEDADETLKRRTLELLFRMTNPVNAAAIVQKLLFHLRLSVDTDFLRDLISKICRLADRFAPDHLWYVRTINDVLNMGGSLVPVETAHNLLRLVAEGPTGNDDEDYAFRQETANIYIALCERAETLPDMLLKVTVWILGEYGSLNTVKGYEKMEALLLLLTRCLDAKGSQQSTKAWILAAIIKLSVWRLLAITATAQSSETTTNVRSRPFLVDTHLVHQPSGPVWPPREARILPAVLDVLELYSTSIATDIEQRCTEFYRLIMVPEPGSPFITISLIKELYPFDGACEDITVDDRLSFLNDFVEESLNNGAEPYVPSAQRRKVEETLVASECLVRDQINKNGLYPTPIGNIPQAPTALGARISPSLNFTPYDPPSTGYSKTTPAAPATTTIAAHQSQFASASCARDSTPNTLSSNASSSDVVFHVQGPRKWGPSGYKGLEYTSAGRNSTPSDSMKVSTSFNGKSNGLSYSGQDDGRDMPYDRNNHNEGVVVSARLAERQRAAEALFSGLTPASTSKASAVSTSTSSPTSVPVLAASTTSTTGVYSSGGAQTSLAGGRNVTDEVDDSLLSRAACSEKPVAESRTPDLLDLSWAPEPSRLENPEASGNDRLPDNFVPSTNTAGERETSCGPLSTTGGGVIETPCELSKTDTTTDQAGDLLGSMFFSTSNTSVEPSRAVSQTVLVPISRQSDDDSAFENANHQHLTNVSTTRSLRDTVPASATQLPILQPLLTSTEEVSALWPRLPAEKRGYIIPRQPFDVVTSLFQKLQGILGAAVVEIIGLEGILAGLSQTPEDVGKPTELLTVYIHAKLTCPASIDLICRGNNQRLLEDLFQRCQHELS